MVIIGYNDFTQFWPKNLTGLYFILWSFYQCCSSSNYIESHGRIISEWRIVKDVEGSGRWPNLKYYPRICLGGIEGNHKKPVRIDSVLIEIWTKHLQNTNKNSIRIESTCSVKTLGSGEHLTDQSIDIKTDFRKIRYDDIQWTHLAYDRVQLWALWTQ
jgi:hypothetical protein